MAFLEQLPGNNLVQSKAAVVAGIVPEHATEQILRKDVIAFQSNGTRVIRTENKIAVLICYKRNLGLIVPAFGAAIRHLYILEINKVAIAPLAVPVKRHAEHKLCRRHALGEKSLDRFFTIVPSGMFGLCVEWRIM